MWQKKCLDMTLGEIYDSQRESIPQLAEGAVALYQSAVEHNLEKILAAVRAFDRKNRRITMTLRELLGTWMENASQFTPGETVQGTVRSVKEYGSFIELAPNLSGLADTREELVPGDRVSVYIKSIRPERMKTKLQVIEKLPPLAEPEPLRYWITDGQIDRWTYSPPGYEKEPVETVFSSSVSGEC